MLMPHKTQVSGRRSLRIRDAMPRGLPNAADVAEERSQRSRPWSTEPLPRDSGTLGRYLGNAEHSQPPEQLGLLGLELRVRQDAGFP
jgi:hypothetical protein